MKVQKTQSTVFGSIGSIVGMNGNDIPTVIYNHIVNSPLSVSIQKSGDTLFVNTPKGSRSMPVSYLEEVYSFLNIVKDILK